MKPPKYGTPDAENPEWTAEDFKRAKRAIDVFPEMFPVQVRAITKRRPPTKRAAKRLLTLRLNPETIDRFRSTGRGWQVRMSEALDKCAKRQRAASPSRRSA